MLPFTKACGLGNDFVMLVHDDHEFIQSISEKIADRRYGIGCDQIILLNKNISYMRFYNADGSEAEACGNGSRCAAAWILKDNTDVALELETLGGTLVCKALTCGTIHVSMPSPKIIGDVSTQLDDILNFSATHVEIGNPHLVCFTNHIADIATFGPQLEKHPHFPNRTNVGFANIISPNHIELQVYERGTGTTLACGSGACAAVVAAKAKGLVLETVTVSQPGGDLVVTIDADGNVYQTGETKIVFHGAIDVTKL
jgi:diaminopimelate epimerase